MEKERRRKNAIDQQVKLDLLILLAGMIFGALIFWYFDIPTGAKLYEHLLFGGVLGFLAGAFTYVLLTSAT